VSIIWELTARIPAPGQTELSWQMQLLLLLSYQDLIGQKLFTKELALIG
tara:strand:- start:762 stop:908 length:147 start_codon:yes stop_codon:yes gene_type:complete